MENPKEKEQHNLQDFAEVLSNMLDTYKRKNHDYGNSFEESCNKFGFISAVVRMNDKMNRLITLSKHTAEVKEESIKDTLLDLASYAVMTYMWLNNKDK